MQQQGGGIHIDSLTINAEQVVLSGGGRGGASPAAEAPALAPPTPQQRPRDAAGPAELTWQLVGPGAEGAGAPASLAPEGAEGGGGERSEAEAGAQEQGQPPYWDDSGPRQPQLGRSSPQWRLHQLPQGDERDAGTPDAWVRRSPEMIRLTSKHPLNAEPPLPALLAAGFRTPVGLHYVRNHGAVPRRLWADHRLAVTGLVERPLELGMDELAARFPRHAVLATLSCAGNRRREVQLVARTQGFAWGHSAIVTSEWAGAPLRALLLEAGVRPEARYIHFSGPEGEVAAGDGTYSTSIPLWKGLDPLSEVVLAYHHNGRLLQPDHGYPLRAVVPGYIGGRCVKWLTRIELSRDESTNHYHQRDNKVLPADVDQERANREGWWRRPDFVCYNLNIGSVIAAPAHDEVVPLPAHGGGGQGAEGVQDCYTLRGFAHTGGGHLVIRAELSLDGGASWRQARITEREPGRSAVDHNWCWVLWEAQVPLAELAEAGEVRMRAWDDTMNTQPDRPTWNLLGMMQNSHFVVRARREPGPGGGQQLRFLHPVANGRDPGGWMWEERQAGAAGGGPAEGGEQAEEERAAAARGKGWDQLREIGWDEIRRHTGRESCWFVRDGRVYDATRFLGSHPGGASAILSNAGQDASAEFDPIHSGDARRMTLEYLIGRVEGATPPFKAAPAAGAQPEGAEPGPAAPPPAPAETEEKEEADAPALRKGQVLKARLEEREEITHDTRRFRFALARPDQRLGLPVGHHITVSAEIKGERVVRPYTPVTLDHERGGFDLVIKVYRAGGDPRHPEGGKMSQHIDGLAVGDTLDVRGPYGEFSYLGGGRFTHGGRPGRCRRMVLVGGGTGITPLYQVMRAVLEDDSDSTELCLLFANKTEQDILLRRRLQDMAQRYANRVRIHYSLDTAPEGRAWEGSVGHVSARMLKEHAFPPDNDGEEQRPGSGDASSGVEGGSACGGGQAGGDGEGQRGGAGASKDATDGGGIDKDQAGGDGKQDGGGAEAGGNGGPQAGGGRGGEEAGGDGVSGGTIALVCGPPPMVDRACLPALKELGFDEAHIIVF